MDARKGGRGGHMRMVAASRQRRQGVSVPSCVWVCVCVCAGVCECVCVFLCVSYHAMGKTAVVLSWDVFGWSDVMKIQDRGSLEDLRRECKCALVSRLRFGDGSRSRLSESMSQNGVNLWYW